MVKSMVGSVTVPATDLYYEPLSILVKRAKDEVRAAENNTEAMDAALSFQEKVSAIHTDYKESGCDQTVADAGISKLLEKGE